MAEQYIIVKSTDTMYVDKIFRILRKCGYNMAKKFLFHWIPSYSRGKIRRDCDRYVVVLVHDDEVNDYTSTFQMYVDGNHNLYVRKIATAPEYEGKGIGRRNMLYMEEYARQQGCPKVCLDVYAKSKGAVAFYLHNGFKEVGTKRSIRFKELIMEKQL
jgi:ribosomal protein S18 acetylase RimI-like enzyme